MKTKNIVHDLGLAAYIIEIKGKPLTEQPRFEDGKYIFKFDITEEELDRYYVEYLTSKFYSFDRIVKELKKLVFRNKQSS